MTMTMIIRTMMPTKTSAVLKIPADMRMKKPTPSVDGDEFTDDGADDSERDAGSNSGKDIRRDRRKNHLERQLPSLDAHQARQIDVLVVHLAHAGVGIKEIQKEGEQEDDADFRPEADAEPDDEERRESGARNAVEGDDDGLENFRESRLRPNAVSQRDAGDRADGKSDGDLLERDPGVLEQVAVAKAGDQRRKNSARAADQKRLDPAS